MNIDFEEKMSDETDEYLETYIDNRKKYVPNAVRAAVAELQKRGRIFEDTQLQQIEKDLRLKEEAQKLSAVPETPDDLFARSPLYYSEKAIMGFSTVFTVIFGAVLLAINLRGNKKQSRLVILFGLSYFIVVILVLMQLPQPNTGITLLLNGLGGLILTKFFWPKYLGKDISYQARPIWKPLIIAIGICLFFILLSLLGPSQ